MRRSTNGAPGIHDPENTSPHPDPLWLLRSLLCLGLLAFLFALGRVLADAAAGVAPPLVLLLAALTLLYLIGQVLGGWFLYLKARRRPEPRPSTPNSLPLSVDVFVTACGEPEAMVEEALSAACQMRGTHQTYLLDDGHDPALEALAQRLGAGYLTRQGRQHAKAGNLNAALARTTGDLVVIFDVDHVPAPDFLECSLGYFDADPRLGFVQVMVSFSNGADRWIAHAAIETSLDFYNPTSMGMDALGSVTMMGSNAVIRRAALASIGGYRPGLAEDLATSLALHTAGWKSAYVAAPLAPGRAPEDIAGWFTQQMKWARGVFEVLLQDYPRCFGRLTGGQRLCYLVRMTNYWVGPLSLAYLGGAGAVLLSRDPALLSAFQRYLLDLLPLALCYVVIRPVAITAFRHPSVVPRPLWRAVALVYFTWPIYTLAWGMALLGLRLGFKPTPKEGTGSVPPVWLLPQGVGVLFLALGVGLLLGGASHGSWSSMLGRYPLVVGFAGLQCVLPLLVLGQRLNRHRLQGLRDAHKARREARQAKGEAREGRQESQSRQGMQGSQSNKGGSSSQRGQLEHKKG